MASDLSSDQLNEAVMNEAMKAQSQTVVGSIVDLGSGNPGFQAGQNAARPWPGLQQSGVLTYEPGPKPKLIVVTVPNNATDSEGLDKAIAVMEECGYKVALIKYNQNAGSAPMVMVMPR